MIKTTILATLLALTLVGCGKAEDEFKVCDNFAIDAMSIQVLRESNNWSVSKANVELLKMTDEAEQSGKYTKARAAAERKRLPDLLRVVYSQPVTASVAEMQDVATAACLAKSAK